MTIFQALLLGLVQGITEFLPISSSGHLVVLPKLFGWSSHPLVFDTTLHLGTSFALIVFFWGDLISFVRSKNIDIVKKILIACIPAGVLGVFLNDLFETYFRGVSSVIVFLVLGSVLMFVAENFYLKKWHHLRVSATSKKFSLFSAFLVGMFQSLALFPGFSRSGSTISGGMFLGLKREEAARFSFLLAIPIILGAGIFEGYSSFSELSFLPFEIIFSGIISSFVVGLFCIRFLLSFFRTKQLYVFVVYRLIFASVLFLL